MRNGIMHNRMSFLIGIIALATLSFSIRGESTELAHVRLISEASILAKNITLSDIALVETADCTLEQELLSLEIAQMPPVGAQKTISSYAIKNLLMKEGYSGVKVHGLQTAVTMKTRAISKAEIQGIIAEWVAKNLDDETHGEIEYRQLPRQWHIPEGDDIFITIDNINGEVKGNVNLTLRASNERKVLSTAYARILVGLYKDILVTTHPVSRNTVITIDDISFENVDVTRMNSMVFDDIDDIVGMVAKRDLPAQKPILLKDISLPILIEKGEMCRILVVNGNVTMTIAGAKALKDGKKGDLITFSNPMNVQKKLHARVAKSGVALITIK